MSRVAKRIGRRVIGRTLICSSITALALTAFPALASATAPYVVGVSATPTSEGATLSASVYTYGLDTHYQFHFGPTEGYGTNLPEPEGDAGTGTGLYGIVEVHQAISGLTPNTAYHFRIDAHNASGATIGETGDHPFTTLANPPAVLINAASPTAEGFELSGTVNPHGAETTYHFEYGTTTGYGTKVPNPDGNAGSGTTAAPVSQEVKNAALLPNTTYHFRLVAHNSGGSTPSSDRTFTTPPSAPAAPSVVANPPEAIVDGYKLKGAVNPNHLETHYHFEFGTTTAYGENLPAEPGESIGSGETAVPVSQEVTSLVPNTTYHYRVVAHNSEGTAESLDEKFTTPPSPPEVTATPFTQVAGGFDLNGTINPNGGATTYHFQFGLTSAYGSNIPASDASAGSGTAAIPVSQPVGGLPPEVPYHYRLVAHNAGGTVMSNDVEFTTPAEAQLPTPSIPPPPPPAAPAAQFSVGPAISMGTTASLQVKVPGSGTVSASGKDLKPVVAVATGSGAVNLRLKLSGTGSRALRRAKGHKLKLKVKISYLPVDGNVVTTTKTLVFKQGGRGH